MIRAIILDWAGTTVDYGSRAPVEVVRELFAAHGCPLEEAEARGPMGLPKRDHIAAILALPRVAAVYQGPTLDELYAEFMPRQMQVLDRFSTLIDGVAETVAVWQKAGILIGSTTGYTRPMLDVLMARAAAQGYTPDATCCPDEAGGGRPAPWMCFACLKELGVYPPAHCVKIGDTPSDIEEGRNAGMWTIAVVDTGNEAGNPSRLQGAHYVAASLPQCLAPVNEIARRIAAGERP